MCHSFFSREISKEVATDIFIEIQRQSCAYDQYIPTSYVTPLDRDERLRADLLDCLSFVLERVEI